MDDVEAALRLDVERQLERVLRALPSVTLTSRRAQTLQTEGRSNNEVFLIESGWVSGSILLKSGARQIVSLYLPGDVIGFDDLFRSQTTETLSAITTAVVRRIDRRAVYRSVAANSEFALSVLATVSDVARGLKLQLASIGRTPAQARVAALLLKLAERLTSSSLADGSTFELLASQNCIGDIVGLTPVHVNRTLMKLSAASLIRRNAQTITIVNVEALRQEAEVPS